MREWPPSALFQGMPLQSSQKEAEFFWEILHKQIPFQFYGMIDCFFDILSELLLWLKQVQVLWADGAFLFVRWSTLFTLGHRKTITVHEDRHKSSIWFPNIVCYYWPRFFPHVEYWASLRVSLSVGDGSWARRIRRIKRLAKIPGTL